MDINLKSVILAAGKGTRLQSADDDSPKVMRTVCSRPMLWYVLDALSFVDKRDTIIVVGYRKDDVIEAFPGYTFAVQSEQLGTGHAVMSASSELLSFNGGVLVCCGDMPTVRRETYEALVHTHFEEGNDCTILTGQSALPLPYGRIIRDESGLFREVVEERDCTPEQLKITELNSGVYIFNAKALLDSLKQLTDNNAQGEYYLTDVPAIMRKVGSAIGILQRNLGDEIIGVNTLAQLRQVEQILSDRRVV